MSQVSADELAFHLYEMMTDELSDTGALPIIMEEFAEENDLTEEEASDLMDKIRNKLKVN